MKKKKPLKYRLPQHSPPENLWDNIKDSLAEQDCNKQWTLKTKLPEYKAPDYLFSQIENKINRRKLLLRSYLFYKIAASILIVITVGLAYFGLRNVNYHTKISHHTLFEKTKSPDFVNTSFQEGKDIKNLLSKECKEQPDVCDSERFKDLTKKLAELEKEEAYLKKQISKYKDDNLTTHLIQIKKDKEKVKRYLVSLFI